MNDAMFNQIIDAVKSCKTIEDYESLKKCIKHLYVKYRLSFAQGYKLGLQEGRLQAVLSKEN